MSIAISLDFDFRQLDNSILQKDLKVYNIF